MTAAARRDSPPLGALVVIAIGLLACVAAALLSTEEPLGATALSWTSRHTLADSAPVRLPGGGEARIGAVTIRTTAPNASGYKLYRVAATLALKPRRGRGPGRVICGVAVPSGALLVHTPDKPAFYPRPSEELIAQPVPPSSEVEFDAQGASTATVSVNGGFRHFTNEPGIGVSWGARGPTSQHWQWTLPSDHSARALKLSFVSIWRTSAKPGALINCLLNGAGGSARTQINASLSR